MDTDESVNLEKLSPALLKILERELSYGNRISETTQGWPRASSIVVLLEYEFLTPVARNLKGVVYREVNDPQYWKAEYFDPAYDHTLACAFD